MADAQPREVATAILASPLDLAAAAWVASGCAALAAALMALATVRNS